MASVYKLLSAIRIKSVFKKKEIIIILLQNENTNTPLRYRAKRSEITIER